ncbi:histidine--tRNA ligase [Paramicrobacterium agarici]|uniref:histidine--tRNA ligase n=1 Tax=Paramicrobacterium agarici TaxID=630514 RepID=UPI00114FFDE8|nr:histidine--tRNA ligase [Microbacterium agarici]TQO21679.1 histidyl-tRNA synthetase [Microbacterium agarici]
MASPVTPPRGMRDYLPADKAKREYALGRIRDVYTRYGFDEIETPVVEDYQRLHGGLGGDNEKLTFNVLKRGLGADDLRAASESGDVSGIADLGLRFDLTVPLARFYTTHRGELPPVFRAIQIAPVWRAERPQKGRYRQFVQCDIDIFGESGPLAEIELISATAAALRELGLSGFTFRLNDRRILTSMLTAFGFVEREHPGVLITIDKLDKIGAGGVVAELREREATASAIDALEAYLARIDGLEAGEFGVEQIRSLLPEGVDDEVIAELAGIGDAVRAASTAAGVPEGQTPLVQFDPFLVRGMGYYTGPIFEIHHPELGYSLGGGGRYDNVVGRFLGQEVPASGASLGFDRLVDLIDMDAARHDEALVLVYDRGVDPATLVALKTQLVARGARVRLEKRAKNLKGLLDRVTQAGFTAFAVVRSDTRRIDELEFKPLA